MKAKYIVFIFLGFISFQASAKIILPRLISDGLVLQRDKPIIIWGWADVNESVTVSFNEKKYVTKAGVNRKWTLSLKPQAAGGPYEMVITGSNTIIIKNILLGDVWFCSGQSNMEYELWKSAEIYPKEIAASDNNLIRHFSVKKNIAFNTADDIESEKGWESANPTSILNWTAVGYFYAQKLFERYKVPIGLINCSYGGTPAEAWINENELKDFSAYYKKAVAFKDSSLVNSITQKDKKFIDEWNNQINKKDIGTTQKWFADDYNTSDWRKMLVPNYWQDQGLADVEAGVVWFTKEINIPSSLLNKNAVLKVGNILQKDITYFNGTKVGTTSSKYPLRKYLIDKSLLKEGKNIITIRILNESGKGGFLTDKPYQLEIGDSIIDLKGEWKYNVSATSATLLRDQTTRFQDQTSSMYHGMLEPLIGYAIKGVIWYQGESNISRANEYNKIFSRLINSWRKEWKQGDFPFLFVQLANNNLPKSEPGESKLATLQEAQQLTLSLPNTGMAVANDIGEWNDVHPLNKLDVGKRLALIAQKVAYGDNKIVYSGPVYKSMKVKANKIVLTFSNAGSGLIAKDGSELKYFSIADASKNFVWANATISGNTITVWNDNIASPVAVRYAWADNPSGANLYNREGLPASSFRTDK